MRAELSLLLRNSARRTTSLIDCRCDSLVRGCRECLMSCRSWWWLESSCWSSSLLLADINRKRDVITFVWPGKQTKVIKVAARHVASTANRLSGPLEATNILASVFVAAPSPSPSPPPTSRTLIWPAEMNLQLPVSGVDVRRWPASLMSKFSELARV